MFTGLVEGLARVVRVSDSGDSRRFSLDLQEFAVGVAVGDSIALDGCCLTAIAIAGSCVDFEAGPETLSRTTLGTWTSDRMVNIERALALGARLGGHLVQGHVDTVAVVAAIQVDGDWSTITFDLDPAYAAQLIPKGSIAVDGVSLTVVNPTHNQFSVALIPHTLAVTRLSQLRVGQAVNIELDMMGKYIWRALEAYAAAGRFMPSVS